MPTPTLRIQCAQPASVIIRRPDGLFYNTEEKKFVSDAQKIPTLVTSFDKHLFELEVEIDRTEFPDGDYSIYFYMEDKLIDSAYSTVFQGDVRRQSPTDLTMRIMKANVGGVTLREGLAKLFEQVNAIAEKLGVTDVD